MEATQRLLAATNGAVGYQTRQAGLGVLAVTRSKTPTWAIAVVGLGLFIVLFGLLIAPPLALLGIVIALGGALGFVFRQTETLTISVIEKPTGCEIGISGLATPELRSRVDLALGDLGVRQPSAGEVGRRNPAVATPGERVSILSDQEKYRLASAPAPVSAGWSADPLDAARERFFNGEVWTGRTRSGSASSSAPAVPEAPTRPVDEPSKSAQPQPQNLAPEESVRSQPVLDDALLTKLSRLNELHKSGGLTDEEFAELKRQALGN